MSPKPSVGMRRHDRRRREALALVLGEADARLPAGVAASRSNGRQHVPAVVQPVRIAGPVELRPFGKPAGPLDSSGPQVSPPSVEHVVERYHPVQGSSPGRLGSIWMRPSPSSSRRIRKRHQPAQVHAVPAGLRVDRHRRCPRSPRRHPSATSTSRCYCDAVSPATSCTPTPASRSQAAPGWPSSAHADRPPQTAAAPAPPRSARPAPGPVHQS